MRVSTSYYWETVSRLIVMFDRLSAFSFFLDIGKIKLNSAETVIPISWSYLKSEDWKHLFQKIRLGKFKVNFELSILYQWEDWIFITEACTKRLEDGENNAQIGVQSLQNSQHDI